MTFAFALGAAPTSPPRQVAVHGSCAENATDLGGVRNAKAKGKSHSDSRGLSRSKRALNARAMVTARSARVLAPGRRRGVRGRHAGDGDCPKCKGTGWECWDNNVASRV